MKKIILTLLLTLSALINVNAVAVFSLDIDGNGTINASNDGLIIFKYLLNSNANNLHTTISSNAADDRKTTAQLKAYLDNSGDILDVDGNGTTNASNDGLIVFKYLLNSNANNLHTTIASNAPGSKTTTINLKAYLDQYTNTDVSNLYSGDRPTELTAEQIADADGAGNYGEHVAVLETANFSDYTISVDLGSRKIYVYDDASFINVVAEIYLGDNYTSLNNLGEPEFRGFFLETIQAIWDLVNPTEVRANRIAQLDALPSQYSLTDTVLIENTELGVSHVNWAYTQNGNQRSFSLSTSVALIEDITDWSTKYNELVAKLIADYATFESDLTAIFASDTAPTELTPLLTAEANRVANTTGAGTSVDKKELFTNLSGNDVTVAYGAAGSDEVFTVSSNIDGNSISNNIIANRIVSTIPVDEADFRAAFFAVILEKWNQLHPVLTAAEELVAIFALATSPTAFVDYPALDAEADGILQAERAQHIVDSLTNLNGVTVTYTINTTPKSFDVAKAGETTINVLQDSSSGGAVSLDTLSVFKDIYFQTIQAKWGILHTALTPAEVRANRSKLITDLATEYDNVNFIEIAYDSNDDYITINSSVGAFYFASGNGDYDDANSIVNNSGHLEDYTQTDFDTRFEALKIFLNPPTFESELADIYAADAPPTGFVSGGEIESATSGFTTEITSGNSKIAFIKRLSSENHLIKTVYQNASNSQVLLVHVNAQNVDLSPRITSPVAKRLDQHTPNDMVSYALEVVKAIWLLEHPEYVDLPALRTERIADLEALDKDGVTVTQATAQADGFVVSTAGKSDVYFYANDYGSLTFEGLTTDQYIIYEAAIEAKRDEYILAAELAVLKTVRINELEALDKNSVTVQVLKDNNGDIQYVGVYISVSNVSEFHVDDYGNGNGKVEDLSTTDYATYKADIISKRDELDPISTAKIQAVLETFYNGSEAAALDIDNYGGQLSAVSTLLATAANAAFDNGLAAQETFLKLLAHGASFQGSSSKVLWDSTGNYYHIVTSNVGSGNGYFDIFLDDNHHYLPNANPGTVMVQNNFRHLAYHVIANLWHLADTTDAELRVFREDWLESYTTQNGAIFNKEKDANDSDQYRASTITNSGQGIATSLYGNVQLVEDLSLTKWVSFRDIYTFSVTTLLGL